MRFYQPHHFPAIATILHRDINGRFFYGGQVHHLPCGRMAFDPGHYSPRQVTSVEDALEAARLLVNDFAAFNSGYAILGPICCKR